MRGTPAPSCTGGAPVRRLIEGWYSVLGALFASGIYIGGGALLLILIIVLIVLLVR